jgi:hypothetical protein
LFCFTALGHFRQAKPDEMLDLVVRFAYLFDLISMGARRIPEMKSFKLLLVIAVGTTTAALVYFVTGLHPI